MNARTWHRRIAGALVLFLGLHLLNHLALIISFDTHKAWLDLARHLYRPRIVEFGLLALLAAQAGLGLWLTWKRGVPRWHRSAIWPWVQSLSGLYLVFFLVQHVPAVLMARTAVPAIETDAQFAAALVQLWPIGIYGAVYYVLAVASLFTHLAAAKIRQAPRLARLAPWIGIAYGVVLVAAMAGLFHDATVSQAHRDHLSHMLPGFMVVE